MDNLVRREIYETARTIVVKVGTNVLSRDDDTVNEEVIQRLADQIAAIRKSGRQVVLVSSGAVGAGMGLLSLTERPRDLAHLQAAAATGQARLIRLYDEAFKKHGTHAAQLLLTAEDFKHRDRYLNVRNTLYTLFEYGVVPIVNENDTVSVQEIKFGDNDQLASMVTSLLPDPLLVILSIVDGLYDGDPESEQSRPIRLVARWKDDLQSCVSSKKSARGTGGMSAKLKAIRNATTVGENVILASGRDPNILERIANGEEVGTLFLAEDSTMPAFKRWIGYTIEPHGTLHLDAGASQAVEQQGRSLLPIGVTAVDGDFKAGELIVLRDPSGRPFARGLSNYGSSDARQIIGRRTDAIADILGAVPYKEIVHRDNLVLIGTDD
ncbi:glutamate 5-kinase [Calycomorphotria hydatis]|uniref:Glutamate 5-kinase n=1 Tax=Calycomorphotria hydatis TaxID=2528027 RepID=A0A517T8F5_9PLAN|nr:glutamate 5-kinase [Calycomorphotria hydatis]QDT64653.1 Glutamate 5-kinase [Calycomorphotria hydatis]